MTPCLSPLLLLGVSLVGGPPPAAGFSPLRYNHPALEVDLGVGLWAWPLPMDYDGDGDLDLVVSCPDKPYNGTYFFENRGVAGGAGDRGDEGAARLPVLAAGVRVAPGHRNVCVSERSGKPVVTLPGEEFPEFRASGFEHPRPIAVRGTIHPAGRKLRARQWKWSDVDGDGDEDLVVGIGDWTEYGWDDAFDASGRWTRGPLHGSVYLLERNAEGLGPAVALEADGRPIDVFGWPSPNLADFDGDGDLDLLCGEFKDRLSYFENAGTRRAPRYTSRGFLERDGELLRMPLCMIVPVAIDWDGDGDQDLVVGQEDGRVALLEHTGRVVGGKPRFEPPRFFRQVADRVKFGALVTPFGVDWDGDGDDDLVCGNTAGEVAFIENLDGGDPPRWAPPRPLEAGGATIRIQAGENGSIQGPAEAKWGYSVVSVADWDHDGRADLLLNSIRGEVLWYRNVGEAGAPRLAAAVPVEVEWPAEPPYPEWNWWKPKGKQLVTQWRSSVVAADVDGDGLNDLVLLDHEGYLALCRRRRDARGGLTLLPPERVFRSTGGAVYDSGHRRLEEGRAGGPLRLNGGRAGSSGRRKFCLVDWDGDGRLDLLVNGVNAQLLRNVAAKPGEFLLEDQGPVADDPLGGHTTCPAVVDWDRDGVPDLVLGAEDGHLYYLRNPHAPTSQAQEEKEKEKEPAAAAAGGATAAGKPAEGGLAPFLGPARFAMQPLFTDERFPNVVVGVEGTVLAVWGNRRVRARRSEDGGASWGPAIPIADPGFMGGGVTVDERDGDVFVFVEAAHPPAPLTVYRSTDEGATWSPVPVEIGRDPHGNLPSMHMNEAGITLRHGAHAGRLLRATRYYAGGNVRAEWPNHYTNAIFSDDGGRAWRTSAAFPENGTGEAAVVELSDGTLYYNSRVHWPDADRPTRRRRALSRDGGETWKEWGVIDVLPDGRQDRAYGCMGGLARLPVRGRDVLLFSNLDTRRETRERITVWTSADGGRTWPRKRLVFDGPSAYSSLAAGRPGTPSEGWIYLHFEGGPAGGEGSQVARFNLRWALEGEATGDGELPEWLEES